MNQQQANTIIGQLQQIDTFDFDALIKQVYADRFDLENIVISQISLTEFLHLSKRVFRVFLTELVKRESYIILPFTFANMQLGQASLEVQLKSYFDNLKAGNFVASENILFWLISYQVDNGIFNLISKRQTEQTANSISKLSEKLGLMESSLENRHKEVQILTMDLEAKKKELQTLIIQKRDELTLITASLSTSLTQSNQITALLTKSIEESTRLSIFVEQQEKSKAQSENRNAEEKALYAQTNAELSTNLKINHGQIDEFKMQIVENEKHLGFIEGKREFFEERIEYLQNLIGQEVGANLFKTFKFRKDELEKPVNFWGGAVLFKTIVTIVWIYFLLNNQSNVSDINSWWQAFAVNTLKTIPVFFLLFFSINQYRKERNFQEEYAFRSAVALTINAYAGRLTSADNKDKLIMEAVFGIYKSPIDDKSNSREKKYLQAYWTP